MKQVKQGPNPSHASSQLPQPTEQALQVVFRSAFPVHYATEAVASLNFSLFPLFHLL